MAVDGAGGSTATAATKKLAGKYGVDVELLEKLVRSVNVPSERESGEMPLGGAGAGRYVGDVENGEDIVVREVGFSLSMG